MKKLSVAAAMMAAAGIALTGSVDAALPSQPLPNTPTIAIVGDSIANGSQSELQNVLAWRVQSFSAANGRTMVTPRSSDSAAGKIAPMMAYDPDWLVIVLGVNDHELTEATAREHADQLLSEAKVGAPWPCVLWVLPSVNADVDPAKSASVAAVRAGILTALTDEPCFRTVEASGLATTSDGIHLTLTGKQNLARIIDSATR